MVHIVLNRARRAESGVSLAELTIVIVVVSIAAFVFTGMFIEAVRSYQFIDTEKGMLQEARYAEERMARELKRVLSPTSVTTAAARTLSFVDRDTAAVSFSWSGVQGEPLLYTKNGAPVILAAGVDSLAFSYWKADGTPAAPVTSPSTTDIWRISVRLRLARNGQSVDAIGAAFVRSL
jgi:Tfp pilus assembly protein PilE